LQLVHGLMFRSNKACGSCVLLDETMECAVCQHVASKYEWSRTAENHDLPIFGALPCGSATNSPDEEDELSELEASSPEVEDDVDADERARRQCVALAWRTNDASGRVVLIILSFNQAQVAWFRLSAYDGGEHSILRPGALPHRQPSRKV
jgi:hypothetical protein